MLLVDDDQADACERREHRRAWPDAHPRLAAAQPEPLVATLPLRQRRVQDRHHVPEPGLESPQRLRRHRDLGHEHDRGPARVQHRLDRAEVHLGLARAGDAVQQELVLPRTVAGRRCARSGPDRLEQARQRRRLGGHQRRCRRRRGADRVRRRPARAGAPIERHQSAGREPSQRIGAKLGRRRGPGAVQRRQQLALTRGQPWRRRPGVGVRAWVRRRVKVRRRLGRERVTAGAGQLRDEHALGAGTLRGAGREHQRQCPGGRRAVLVRHPLGERDQFGRQCRFEHLVGLRQLSRVDVGRLAQSGHDAERPLAAEPDPQHRPDADGRRLRVAQAVVERAADGARSRQRLNPSDHGDRI